MVLEDRGGRCKGTERTVKGGRLCRTLVHVYLGPNFLMAIESNNL